LVTGAKYLTPQHILSKFRGRIFAFAILSVLIGVVIITSVIIFTRQEDYSVYYHLKLASNWSSAIVSLSVFLLIEAILAVDFSFCCLANFASLYFSCLIMKFWLHQVWLVQFKGGFMFSISAAHYKSFAN